MIYFDNSATTIKKPPEVAEAVSYAINSFGNAGRSFYDAVLLSNREIYNTRTKIAELIGLNDPLNIAFTSSCTESLNLVIGGLVNKDDSVITTVTEHNSVLRPLYLTGCDIGIMDCDDNGKLIIDSFEKLLKPSVRFLICTHGSNVTGNITDVVKLYSLCKEAGITMILDISQTFGAIPVGLGMADIFCFTGHKNLFGPQGTGGIIVNEKHNFSIVKTGGSGVNSFEKFQQDDMPAVFEAGTLNSHGIYGLQKGVNFILKTGIESISAKENRLSAMFYDGIKDMEQIKIYGDFEQQTRLPVISINVRGLTSSELSEKLWTRYGIATRAGSHCAPLLHKRFGTVELGMTRFSFSYFNTEEEINKGISAVREICNALR